MELDTMQPTPTFDETAYEDTVDTLAAHDDLTYKVWGGDWCKDCRAALPDFAAALDAAGIPDDRIEHYPVEREDGEKVGPLVEEYGIELIPTIIVERNSTDSQNSSAADDAVERDGDEVARFVEEEDRPAATFIAEQLEELETSP
ncbi:TlpA family protein disulfide reductase [Halostella pelagica]|uniref:TlpA family protein disulfide reductase n=1 Tax=Halostella pelagica TaxID=2583824 RepID=UPI00108034AE|nr:thioredoxin family protein [Halostella pelagica]